MIKWSDFWAKYVAAHPDMDTVEAMNLSGESYHLGMQAMREVVIAILDHDRPVEVEKCLTKGT